MEPTEDWTEDRVDDRTQDRTDDVEARPGSVSLIAAGTEDIVPSGIPFGVLPLVSLETDEVLAWLERHRRYVIYVVPGAEHQSEGVPALSVPVTATDYELVLAAIPR